MKLTNRISRSVIITSLAAVILTTLSLQAKAPSDNASVPMTMTITASVDESKRMPEIQKEDIFVKKGQVRLPVASWTAAQGDRAGLELFILIDDASNSSIGNKLDELRTFISAQPETTAVGIAYLRNAVVQILQDPTSDHALASKALRLPLATAGAYGSPYLSVVDLMKRWPETSNRREILLITDGIDRAGRGGNALLNPDVDTAANVAQRAGVMIHTLYSPGVGHWHRSYWRAINGQNAMAKLSDATGGESYFLGLGSPVSFTPYLDSLQKVLDNQFVLSFLVSPEKKAAWQYINVSTEIPGVDLGAADAVWVPAAK